MKSLLLTGGTGFLGKNILSGLRENYAVTTLGLSAGNDVSCNLATEIPALGTCFDIVLHAAGKAHTIPRNLEEEKSFFDVNRKGTEHLCMALEQVGIPSSVIFISSVAVYGENEGELVEESHPLNGKSAYALSKIQAEEILHRWCAEHGVKLCILRPSLMVGNEMKGTLFAMERGIRGGYYWDIAGGRARKSVVATSELVRLMPLLEEMEGVYNFCDSSNPTLADLSAMIARRLNRPKPGSIPLWLASVLAHIGNHLGPKTPFNDIRLTKMTRTQTFSNEKARKELGWEPLDVLGNYRV